MSITAGQLFRKIVSFDNDYTGEPVGADVISGMDLRLHTDRSRQIAKLTIGSGISKIGDGQFVIEIPATETIKLAEFEGDNVFLEGYLLPCQEPIIFELGMAINNKAND